MFDINKLVDEFEGIQKTYQQKLQVELALAFEKFFVDNPHVKAIAWDQFTPYFNDGEECVFCVNDFVFCSEVPEDLSKTWRLEDEIAVSSTSGDSVEAFRRLVYKIPNDIFKAAFGDHVTVLATKDGFQTEECEHD